jgi:hypothetical protein
MIHTFSVIFIILFCNNIFAQFDNDQALFQNVFQSPNRGGFGEIVTPEPNVQPTTAPTFLENEGRTCKCVPYHACHNQGTESRIEIDVRYNPETCQDILDVCCPLEREIAPGGNAGSSQLRPQTPPPITSGPLPISQISQCGIRNPNGIDFSLTGNTQNEAGFAEFPW